MYFAKLYVNFTSTSDFNCIYLNKNTRFSHTSNGNNVIPLVGDAGALGDSVCLQKEEETARLKNNLISCVSFLPVFK
jgi:hypothetical protein